MSEELLLKGLKVLYANRELKDDGLNNLIIGVRAGLLPLDRVSKSAGARMGKRKQLDDSNTYVYFARCIGFDAVKIGVAEKPQSRLKQSQVHNPFELELAATVECRRRESACALEKYLHNQYDEYCIRGEWLKTCVLDAVLRESEHDQEPGEPIRIKYEVFRLRMLKQPYMM